MISIVFSRKELESVVFVKEEFLHKKIQKKEDVFVDLTTNSLIGRQCETVWRLVNAKRRLKSLIKFAHYVKRMLAWLLKFFI